MCSETELLNDWNKFPEGKLCDCSKSSLFVYSPRLKKLAARLDPETPDFLKNKSKRETMEKLDDKEKCKRASNLLIL